MKVIESGHTYEVLNVSNAKETQRIFFIQKKPVPNGKDGEMFVFQDGTTNEELLDVMINRLNTFQEGAGRCRQNALAITKMEEARFWLEDRTKERIARGVEGTHKK
jgi:hypothetical protein